MIFWNIAGIGNKDEDFWDYIQNFDIVNLTETWTELKSWKRIEKWLPKEFRWEIQDAVKDKKKDRSAGGMLTGKREKIRKTLEVKKVNIDRRDIISIDLKIKEEDWKIISVYNRNGKKSYLKTLEEEIEKERWKKLTIGGDFNARIAEKGNTI